MLGLGTNYYCREDKNPYRTHADFKNLLWVWGVDRKKVRGLLFGITRLCQVMPNSDTEGHIFISPSNNHDRFFFLHTFWSPAFDFNVGVPINELHSCKLTSAILKFDIVCDVVMTSTPNILTTDRVTWSPIQPMYWQHMLVFDFYLSHGSDKGM